MSWGSQTSFTVLQEGHFALAEEGTDPTPALASGAKTEARIEDETRCPERIICNSAQLLTAFNYLLLSGLLCSVLYQFV